MDFLLVREKGNKFKLYSPDIYGVHTWGQTSQDSIRKKKKNWYKTHWTAGNDFIDDLYSEHKLNVVLESTDIREIVRYALKYNESEAEHLLTDAQCLYNDYIGFMLWQIRSKGD